MKLFLKHNYLFISILFFSILSCSKTEGPKEKYLEFKSSIENSSIDFKNNASKSIIKLSTNVSNLITIVESDGQSWCKAQAVKIDDENTNIEIVVTENSSSDLRETSVTIKGDDLLEKTLKVRQLGYELQILVSTQIFSIDEIGGTIGFNITTNVKDFDITSEEWIKEEENTKSASMVTSAHNFSIGMNKADTERVGKIIIKDKNSDLKKEVLINQKGLGNYNAGSLDGIKDDIKIQVAGGEASSQQAPNETIEKSFDGNFETMYHSAWDNRSNPDKYFPITLTYNFSKAEAIDYLVYYPRQSGSNGFFKETEIWAKLEGSEEFVKILDKDFKGSSSATKVFLDNSLTKSGDIKKYKSIRFIIKSGVGDGIGFASCSEMEFYSYNPDKFDYSELFTDNLCQELKPGVTEETIKACKYPFFKKIAYYMLNGKYPRDFRIAEFNAYPNPSIDARINKFTPQSLLDNPTGISVAEGEDVVVFANNLQGQSISIRVQDFDVQNADGFWSSSSYPISEGFNKFKVNRKGLLYVMYNSDDYKTTPTIKLHIASGEVNGYFDVRKHKAEDWSKLINAAKNKHFDVVGKYSHVVFPVSDFKQYTSNGLNLIGIYDSLVHWEMDFMGLYKFDKVCKNRAFLNVIYKDGAYMYATSNHTAYHVGTMGTMCSESTVKNSPWGPAHEVGHTFQTGRGMKWIGTTEVTNNIHSLYVQTKFGNGSRIQVEDLKGEGYTNRYEKAMNSLLIQKDKAHCSEKDVFCKLVPFWQLYLYVSEVKGNTDFYKNIYEDVRNTPNDGGISDGQTQLDFVKRCCKYANLDLTDFFTEWGFLTVVSQEVDDYAKRWLTVTEDMVTSTLNEIKKYPKPEHKLQYITDNNKNAFGVNSKMVAGNCSVSGQTVTFTGSENVAVYEVYDANRLIFISSEPSFTVKNLPNKFSIKAVSAKGEKVDISF
jgi:F5/8 type C domain.